MRKRSARKWLHFILDLLPVIFIPVFMVYSHRHTIDSYSVTREEVNEVNVYQLVENGLPSNADGYYSSFDYVDIYYRASTSCVVADGGGEEENSLDYNVECSFSTNDIIFISFYVGSDDSDYLSANVYDINLGILFRSGDFNPTVLLSEHFYIFTVTRDIDNCIFDLYSDRFKSEIYLAKFQLFNLTDIFGSGNEPTAEEFNTFLNGRYLPYGNNYLTYGTQNVTYNDTDILSQLIYSMYNATDKYFNFNKLFNMQYLYNWVQNNFFGGNAPLIIPVVWNIIVYELFMDILFLIYAVFMFVVDFATNMVDSFLSKSKRGDL